MLRGNPPFFSPARRLLGVVGQAWLPVDLSASPPLCPWLRHVPRRSFSRPRFGVGVPVPVPSLCRSGGSCYGPCTAGLHLRLALSGIVMATEPACGPRGGSVRTRCWVAHSSSERSVKLACFVNPGLVCCVNIRQSSGLTRSRCKQVM